MKIGIIIGSVREGRRSQTVAQWVYDQAVAAGGADFEIIDLKSFEVPVLTSGVHPMMANKDYETEAVNNWSKAIDACDGYIFVTPEYNHGVPGAFKNAFDSLGPEWVGKTVAFVSHGADGGVRAVEQWRTIVANFQMLDVRAQIALSAFLEFDDNGLSLHERREGEMTTLLEQLLTLTGKVR